MQADMRRAQSALMFRSFVVILFSAFATGFLIAHGIDVRAVEFMPLLAIIVMIYGVLLAAEVGALVDHEREEEQPVRPATLGHPSVFGR
jgi:hypothetical protein